MFEFLSYVGTTLVAGGSGWLFSKLLTKREKKASDLQLINEAIKPLLESIASLTNHANEVTEKYAAEQAKTLRLMQERAAWLEEKATLTRKVESLEQKVLNLTQLVKKLAKNEKDDSNITV